MRLAIIGAGVAGLMAARELRGLVPQLDVTVYEKSRGFGGRVATRRRAGFAFDHGAQVIKSPDSATERLLREELPADDLRSVELPVWLFDVSGAITPGDPQLNAEASWCYGDGNNRLGKLLAEGIDVRREVRIASLVETPGGHGGAADSTSNQRPSGYTLLDTSGASVAEADLVLLTAPAPQSAEILAASAIAAGTRDALLAELAKGTYRRCISLALAYDRPIERPYYALLNSDRAHPISWLGLEHIKGPQRCPPGHSLLIAQMAPRYSVERWDESADDLAPEVCELVSALLGLDLRQPLWFDRQGWRYALPDSSCDFALLNSSGSGLFFAGDFTTGPGRVHLAIESGRRVAQLIAAVP